jgi:hypothetical protein
MQLRRAMSRKRPPRSLTFQSPGDVQRVCSGSALLRDWAKNAPCAWECTCFDQAGQQIHVTEASVADAVLHVIPNAPNLKPCFYHRHVHAQAHQESDAVASRRLAHVRIADNQCRLFIDGMEQTVNRDCDMLGPETLPGTWVD